MTNFAVWGLQSELTHCKRTKKRKYTIKTKTNGEAQKSKRHRDAKAQRNSNLIDEKLSQTYILKTKTTNRQTDKSHGQSITRAKTANAMRL